MESRALSEIMYRVFLAGYALDISHKVSDDRYYFAAYTKVIKVSLKYAEHMTNYMTGPSPVMWPISKREYRVVR